MSKLYFIPADSRTLQLDIDNNDSLKLFYKQLPWFSCIANEHKMGLHSISLTHSRSGRNWHVEIKLGVRLKLWERIAWQAILGSDRMRELCNAERVKCHSPHPILFIKENKICRYRTAPVTHLGRNPIRIVVQSRKNSKLPSKLTHQPVSTRGNRLASGLHRVK